MSLPKISVIGTGALGNVLTAALVFHDASVASVFNRTSSKATQLADKLGIAGSGDFPASSDELGPLTFLTVSDGALRHTAQRLARLKGDLENYTFVHCSGNESAAILQPLKDRGAVTASFHPLQTFTAESSPNDFQGIYFSLQGDYEAFPLLRVVAGKLGAQTLEVSAGQKSNLHAAAVLASNYLTALLDASVELGTQGGLPVEKVKQALLPLVETTLKNASQQPFDEALSGPIKRGDVATVRQHLDLLDNQPELKNVYCVLGLQTVKLAESSGELGESIAQDLREMLRSGATL